MLKPLWVLAVACLLLCGCPKPAGDEEPATTTVVLGTDSFPSDVASYHAVLRSFLPDGDSIARDRQIVFGTVGCDESTSHEITIDTRTVVLIVYLLPDATSQEPVYFGIAEFTRGPSDCAISFWLDYPEYFYAGNVRYGVSRQREAVLPFDVAVAQDYSLSPYFLYRLPGIAGRSVGVDLSVTSGAVSCLGSDSYANVVHGTASQMLYQNDTTYWWDYAQNDLYLLARPQSYEVTTRALLAARDCSLEGAMRFSFSHVVPGVAGIYLADLTNRQLKRVDLQTQTIETLASFDAPIKALVRNAAGTLYVGEGARIWTCDTSTGAVTHVYDAPANIYALHVAGDYLVSEDDSGSWTKHRLIRVADFKEMDVKEWVYRSQQSAFAASQNRLYLLRDGISPSDVCYQDIDFANEKLGAYGDSMYHGQYNFWKCPRLFPDETKVVCSPGTILNTDSALTYSGTLGLTYEDLLFHGGRIYLLQNFTSSNQVWCRLIVVDQASPYRVLSTPVELHKKGRAIFVSGDRLILVAQTSRNPYTWTEDKDPISVYAYPLSGMDTGQSASPAVLSIARSSVVRSRRPQLYRY